MLKTAFVAARDRKRLQQIVTVLAKFGLDDLTARSGVHRLLPLRIMNQADASSQQLSYPERVRRALEELGPTFVKLGQILATRSDLLSPVWTEEFERLHSRVAPLPFHALRAQVEEDLGAPPEEVFASFDPEPLASASIAQVYRAALSDGRQVVLKVRRPGLRTIIQADIRLLMHLAEVAESEWPDLRRYRPREIVRNLGAAMSEELDLANEGRNCESVAAHFSSDVRIVFPAIHWAYTSERLLVQDYMDGIKPVDAETLARAGIDQSAVAAIGADAFLKMVFADGVFHADPHPGNLLCLPGDQVGFLDFGMLGRLSNQRREEVVRLIKAIVDRDGAGVATVLRAWGGAESWDDPSLEAATEAFAAKHGLPPLNLSRAVSDFMAIARDHALPIPADLTLLFKAMLTAEGVVRRLDPDINLIERAEPIVRRAMLNRFAPRNLADQTGWLLEELRNASLEAPGTVRALMRTIRSGRIRADVNLAELNLLGRHLERAATKIAIAIVAGAFALGLAPQLGPSVFGIPLFVVIGVLAMVGCVAWLILALRR